MNTSFQLTLRDEIALEGLEGITLDALWTRLEERDGFLRRETQITSLNPTELLDNKMKTLMYKLILKDAKNGIV